MFWLGFDCLFLWGLFWVTLDLVWQFVAVGFGFLLNYFVGLVGLLWCTLLVCDLSMCYVLAQGLFSFWVILLNTGWFDCLFCWGLIMVPLGYFVGVVFSLVF